MNDTSLLLVKRTGNSVVLRSRFSASQDLVLTLGLGSNRQIGFGVASLIDSALPTDKTAPQNGTMFHSCGDDSTPWNFNGTYIGGNHGCSDLREVVCAEHGLSEADLGSEWRDAAGAPFYLLRVVTADKLWFLSENTGEGAIWRFNTKIVGDTLTRTDPATTLSFQEYHMAQLTPASRIREQSFRADGREDLPEGEWVTCGFLEVLDDYEIVSPAAVLADVRAHPGMLRDPVAPHLDAVVSNRIRHCFYPNGAVVIRHESRALQEFRMGYMGFIQSAPLTQGTFDTHEYYIPGTLPFEQEGVVYDFQAFQDYSSKLPVPLLFGAAYANVVATHDLPSRFLQFLGSRAGGQNVRKIGYALGYSPVRGLTRIGERERHASTAIMLYKSNKSYPHAVDTAMGAIIPAGTEFDCTAYRQYFDAQAYPKATAVYWHPEENDWLLYADYHQSVEQDRLVLPATFTGRRIEIVSKTPSLTLHTEDTVPPEGLTVSVEGDYGCLTLRLVP